MTQYRITVRMPNSAPLSFTILNYDLKEGMVIFVDQKTGKEKAFPTTLCEISEV